VQVRAGGAPAGALARHPAARPTPGGETMAQQHPSTGTARRTVEAAAGRRAPRWAGLALVLAAGCNDTSFFVKGDGEPEGLVPGSIQGRTCDPVGSNWLADATVYTHLIDDAGRLYETKTVYSDRDGKWTLEGLPAERSYDIYVQYGVDVIERFEDVWVGDGDLVLLDEPPCFDPLALDVAVITGDYDRFDLVLDNMGFANYQLIDGLTVLEVTDFLGNLEGMQQYDIIFFNGGMIEEGVLYPDPAGSTTPEVYLENIRQYVRGGGSVYASDWAYDVVELAWPERLDFVGDDAVVDSAQLGEYDLVDANISDAALSEWLGQSTMRVEYDLPVWPPIEAADEAVTVHMRGGVEYRVGTENYALVDSPLLVSFSSGDGRVGFSTFRVARNATQELNLVLQYMMYNL
jgi:hypothetical protein